MFGVSSVARGRRSSRSASTASGRSSRSPLFATITGSTTTRSSWSSTALATARMMAAEDSMPVFAAPTGKSETTAAIWEETSSGSISWTPVTATVFCAVTAVIAERPYTPCAAKVFRSAWIPAPAPESDPAMVRATGGTSARRTPLTGRRCGRRAPRPHRHPIRPPAAAVRGAGRARLRSPDRG